MLQWLRGLFSSFSPEIREEGDDRIVSIRVGVNNSPHVVMTRVEVQGKTVVLLFDVIQDRAKFTRSSMLLEIVWRLPRANYGVAPIRIEQQPIAPNFDEARRIGEFAQAARTECNSA